MLFPSSTTRGSTETFLHFKTLNGQALQKSECFGLIRRLPGCLLQMLVWLTSSLQLLHVQYVFKGTGSLFPPPPCCPDSILHQLFIVRFLGSMEVRTAESADVISETMRQILAARAIHNIFRMTESHLLVTCDCLKYERDEESSSGNHECPYQI